VEIDPRRIDAYQLGTLLCRLLTGGPSADYLRSPRVKAKVPARLQPLLERLSADLIAHRCTLPEAASTAAPLRGAGKHYPGRSEQASVAASLVYYTLFRLHDDPADEETARRLAAESRACYGVPLTLPEPAKGAAIPPCWRAAGLVPAGGS
jgi:hypothetical protein